MGKKINEIITGKYSEKSNGKKSHMLKIRKNIQKIVFTKRKIVKGKGKC